jgi:hypothetical protein
MPLSPAELCSRALLKIGASTITSLDEGTTEAQVAAHLYPITRDALLAAHPWNFAIAYAELQAADEPPVADYSCAFVLPADCLRVLSAGALSRGSGLEYRICGRQLLTDAERVTLTYVQRAAEETFPPFFVMALIAQLAAEFCIPLTDSTSRWEGLRSAAEGEFRRAKMIDSQEETPQRITDFTLIEERS